MTTQEEIQARIEKSKEVYERRRAQQIQTQQIIKEGVAYIHDNKLPMMVKHFENGAKLAICVEAVDDTTYRFAFALCSPKDQFSVRIAKGLVGNRMQNQDVRFSFVLGLAKPQEDLDVLLNMGRAWLLFTALTGHKGTIDCIRRIAENDALAGSFYDTEFYV